MDTAIAKLSEVSAKLRDFLSSISTAIGKIDASTNDMVDSMMSQMNLDGILGKVGDFWTDVPKQGNTVIAQISDPTDQTQRYLSECLPVHYWRHFPSYCCFISCGNNCAPLSSYRGAFLFRFTSP